MRIHFPNQLRGVRLLWLLLVLTLVVSAAPLAAQSDEVTDEPVMEAPTDAPTEAPTEVPTEAPTEAPPTESPTDVPTELPSEVPTETPTELPTTDVPSETPSDIPTELPTETVTDAPTETPAVTDPAVTDVATEPTVEITAEVTTTVTPEITETPLPTEAATPLPEEPALAALFEDPFANGTGAWNLGPAWTVVPSERDSALRAANGDAITLALYPSLYDVAAEARFFMSDGGARVIVRQSEAAGGYLAEVHTDGRVWLYRAGTLLAETQTDAAPGAWRTLRLSAMGGILRVSVDAELVLETADEAPLPPGAVAFASNAPGEAFLDDARILVPADQVDAYPPPVTATPAPVVTAVPTPSAPANTLDPVPVNTFTVTSDLDNGDGANVTLREAIAAANASPGHDEIRFDIPLLSSPFLITPQGCKLPDITDPVTINGYTQVGASEADAENAAVIRIELGGNFAQGGTGCPASPDALTITDTADGTIIRGLAINDWKGNGIVVAGAANVTIAGNIIGLSVEGDVASGFNNLKNGIFAGKGSENTIMPDNLTIGGTTPADRNIISNNSQAGIEITSATQDSVRYAADNVLIVGNYIGTDKGGTVDLGNTGRGVYLNEAPAIVGGVTAGHRNIIAGNNSHGIDVSGPGADGSIIQGNWIGLGASGGRLPNGNDGVSLTGSGDNLVGGTEGVTPDGACTGACNVISGNAGDGIESTSKSGLFRDDNIIQGNFIGPAPDGESLLTGDGITGNATGGVRFSGTGLARVGTDADGVDDVLERNIISGNQGASGATNVYGVYIAGNSALGSEVWGNYIGTSSDGTTALGNRTGGVFIGGGARSNEVGGLVPAKRNLISGNLGVGVEIKDASSTSNRILGNYIGTNFNATAALPNGTDGVLINDAASNFVGDQSAVTARNIISGNTGDGIELRGLNASGNRIQMNYIGTDLLGTSPIPNGGNGVRVTNSARRNQIGLDINQIPDADPGSEEPNNTIAFNGLAGVAVDATGGRGNRIINNIIHSNGGLGIDLGTTGVTLNDAGDSDTGANNLQNYPTLTSVERDEVAGTVTVQATLQGVPGRQYRIDFYANQACDDTGYGEGPFYLGSTVGANPTADVNGVVLIEKVLDDSRFDVVSAEHFTMTVTDFDTSDLSFPEYNTSEFSRCINRNNAPPTISAITNQTTRGNNPTAAIGFTVGDSESLPQNLTLSVLVSDSVRLPGAAPNVVFGGSGASRTVTLTPANGADDPNDTNVNQVVTVTVRVTDEGGAFEDSRFTLTITDDKKPTITAIADTSTAFGVAKTLPAFTVNDVDDGAAAVTLRATSDNLALLPIENITFGGSGGSRTVTVTPAAGQSGIANVVVFASDGNSERSEPFKLTVSANTAPTISTVSAQTTVTNTAHTVAITVGDPQLPAGLLSLTAIASTNTTVMPTGRVSFDAPDNSTDTSRSIIFNPATNQVGTAVVTIRVSDGYLYIDRDVTITVNANTAPTIAKSPTNLAEPIASVAGTPKSFNITINDAFTKPGSLILEASSGNLTALPNANISFDTASSPTDTGRVVTFTPISTLGTNPFLLTIRVRDSANPALEATLAVLVSVSAGTNTPPTITDITGKTTVEETPTQPIPFTVNDAQTNPAALVVTGSSSNTTLVPNANIVFGGSGNNRTVTITPVGDLTTAQTTTITIVVSDGVVQTSDTFPLTVVPNTPPTISNIPNLFAAPGLPRAYLFTVNDLETPLDSLVVTATSDDQTLIPNGSISVSGTGSSRTLTLVPDANLNGTANITVTVTDGNGDEASDTFVLVVSDNNGPTISPINDRTVTPGATVGPILFTVGDVETLLEDLQVEVLSSSSTNLLPLANTAIGGSGAERTLMLYPVAGVIGSTTITVRVTDEVGFTADEEFILTTASAPPGLQSPANLAVVQTVKPTFTWSPISGAARYQIQIDDVNTFQPPLESDRIMNAPTRGNPTFVSIDALTQGTHYWRVRALNGLNQPISGWSSVPAFTVNLMLTPANGTSTTSRRPTFTWAAGVSGSVYQLWVDNNTSFSSPETITCSNTATTCTLTSDLPLGANYWKMIINGQPVPFYRVFYVTSSLPTAPTVTFPVKDSYIDDDTPTVSWSSNGTGFTYDMQLDNNSDFSSPDWVSNANTTTSWSAPQMPQGTIYVRVRARNSHGAIGPWSAQPYKFIIDSVDPSKPGMIAPGNNSTTSDTTPTLTWGVSTGANRYRLEIARDSAFQDIFRTFNLTTTTYTFPTTAALNYGTYYWRVTGLDAANNASPTSSEYAFTVNLLRTPGNNSFTTDQTPTFTFGTYPNAWHTVQVASVADFSTLKYSCRVLSTVTSCTPGTALARGRYYWRVNIGSATAPFSGTFTITATPPAAPTIVLPANGASTNDTTPAVTWRSVSGATAYDIQIDNNSNFGSLAYRAYDVTGTARTVMPALPDGLYYLRMRSKNSVGAPGAWSTARTFRVDTVAPTTMPSLIAPANNTITFDTTPTFSWVAVTGVTRYMVEIARDSDFEEVDRVLDPVLVTGTSYTLWASYALADDTYYWRVRAVDAAGNVGPASLVRKFIIPAP